MRRVLLIVPDGVAVRNYLYSSFIKELQSKDIEVILYHQISESAINEVKKVHPELHEVKVIPGFIEKPIARLIRESLSFARLRFNSKKLQNGTIMDFWNRKQKSLKQKVLYLLAECLGSVLSWNYRFILKMEIVYEKKICKGYLFEKIENDITFFEPDYILNLHQRSPISAPIIAIARNKKIRTGTVIFSWDNVPKARLISRYDSYFVWSEIMKSELSILYPEIERSSIEVVGTPQFECYFQKKYQESKETFFKRYGLDIDKRTICVSANDLSSPYEPNYLQDVCEEISKIENRYRPQVIFRKSPVDKSDRFDSVLKRYENLVFSIEPDWKSESLFESSFFGSYPTLNDFVLLVNTVMHCDAVINFGSTMAHDFAVLNKPCLYLNYNPVNNSSFKVERAYNFQHFRTLAGIDAVGWVNNKNEIGDLVERAINKPEIIAVDRLVWLKRVVKHPIADCSLSIVNAIIK